MMELLGVEFTDYACFATRFIPLRAGVQILVGRNNAGKTAILRGLAAMSGLPFTLSAKLDPGLEGYCRETGPLPSFGLNIWYVLGALEWTHFVFNRDRPSFFDPAASRLIFKFRVFPQQNTVGLDSCVIRTGANEIEAVHWQATGSYTLNRIDEKGVIRHTEEIKLLGNRTQIADLGAFPLLSPTGLFKDLVPLMNVQFVDARRFARTNLLAKEERVLPANAESLAPYLLTLQGSKKRIFNRIQDFITRIFPEFDALNPELKENLVTLTLTLAGTDTKVQLGFCGSGVEQLLALITFLLTTPAGTTILLDEPHTYLHPSAEREFISLLMRDHERSYVISTHSPVMMNSVPADRIINIVASEQGSFKGSDPHSVGPILQSLGYKNSDFLLYDRLILGEGKSDAAVMPVLLKNSKRFSAAQIERTGFPTTEGADSSSSIRKQTIILRYEKMLQELEMSSIARVYLRDGDAAPDEQAMLKGTNQPGSGQPVPIQFLPYAEIENYLLVPEAIAQAMRTLRQFAGSPEPDASAVEIKSLLDALLATDDAKLFPAGRGKDPWANVKGSAVLKKVFERYALRYDKESAGALIAEHVIPDNQPALEGLAALVAHLF